MPLRFDANIGTLDMLPSERSREGFLKSHAIMARTGVLPYLLADGTVRLELLPPEELLAADSIATIAGKPFVDGHPTNEDGIAIEVTPENASQYTRGVVGNDIKLDRELGLVRVTVDVHDAQLIAKIDNGQVEVSGARVYDRLEMTPGIWDGRTQQYWTGEEAAGKPGVPFDAIQRGFDHNHLASVPAGRAGARVRLRLDSADAVRVSPGAGGANKGAITMAKLKIDGVEYDADAGLAAAVSAQATAQAARIAAQDSAIATGEARLAKAEAEASIHKLRADEAGKVDVRALVKRRLALERAPCVMRLDMSDEVVEDMEDRDVMLAAITAALPDYSGEGKSDEIIAAVFEAVKDLAGSHAGEEPGDDGRDALAGARQDASPRRKLDAARREFANRHNYKGRA